MKKICFVTTIGGTFKSFLHDFSIYLVEKCGYDVTFICNDDDSMRSYCTEHIHYIPVSMKRGISLDGLSTIIQLIKILSIQKILREQ